jgi:hypothetical protein
MSDAVATMGTILPDDMEGRDAVHVAVIVRVAKETLQPGQNVSAEGTIFGEPMGIVDPFLKQPVEPGQRFWMFLYPRSITGLAHVWSHPAFPTEASATDKSRSEHWLRDYASANGPSYYTLMRSIEDVFEYGGDEYIHIGGEDAHGAIPDELWHHAEIVLGKKLTGERPKYFTCSC